MVEWNIFQKVTQDEIYKVVVTFFYLLGPWDAHKLVKRHGGGGHSGKSWLSIDKSHNFE